MTQNLHDWLKAETLIFFYFVLPILIFWFTIWFCDRETKSSKEINNMQKKLLCIKNPVRKIVHKKTSKLLKEGWEKIGEINFINVENKHNSIRIYYQNLKKTV